MNRIIKILIYSDVLILSAFSLYLPIFAIFIATTIKGGSVAVAGLAAASYWTVRAIVQLPISRFIDKHDGEKRSFQALILGSFLFSIVPFLFVFGIFMSCRQFMRLAMLWPCQLIFLFFLITLLKLKQISSGD